MPVTRLCNFYLMRQRTHHLHGKLWMGILLVLVQALLPALLHASSGPRSYHAEICTTAGVQDVIVMDETADAQPHCQACVLAQYALPPAPHPDPALSPLWISTAPAPRDAPFLPADKLVLHLRGPPTA